MYVDDFKYFSLLGMQNVSENISNCDLEAYINNLDELREDFRMHFGDLDNMHIL